MIDIDKAFEGRWRIKSQNIDKAMDLMLIEYRVDYVKKLCRDFFEKGILLATATVPCDSSQGLPPPPAKNPLDLRAESFYQQVHSPEFTAKYPPQLLQDFYSYWSEPNKSKTKMRFELQKTWDTSRRLATWARNDFNHYGTNKPTLEQQRRDKLADILAG